MDDSAPAQIEEVLAHTSIAGAPPLPSTNMGKSMFNGYPLTQLNSPLRRLLTLT